MPSPAAERWLILELRKLFVYELISLLTEVLWYDVWAPWKTKLRGDMLRQKPDSRRLFPSRAADQYVYIQLLRS
jgi:hypothetical protein